MLNEAAWLRRCSRPPAMGRKVAANVMLASLRRPWRLPQEGIARSGSLEIRAGRRFALSRHPREAMNREYVVISSEIVIEAAAGRSAPVGECRVVHEIDLVPAMEPFRLPQSTPVPIVAGPHIARVVGKSGEDVFTDEYGRVKVKFRWDPADGEDEKSSCWLRVMQPWAGPTRGSRQCRASATR